MGSGTHPITSFNLNSLPKGFQYHPTGGQGFNRCILQGHNSVHNGVNRRTPSNGQTLSFSGWRGTQTLREPGLGLLFAGK